MSGYEPFPVDADSNRVETTVDPRLAGRWRRFFAWLVDLVAMTAIAFATAFVLAFVVALVSDGDLDEDSGSAAFYGVILLIAVFYYPLLMRRSGRRNGQTLGKQLLGVRVVTREGEPVTFGRAFRRDVLGTTVINFFTGGLYFLADYPVGLLTDRRQTLHDRIAATFVFRADVAVGPLADSSPFGTEQPPRAAAPPARQPEREQEPPPSPTPPPVTPPIPEPAQQRPAEQPSQPWTPPRSPDYDRQRDEVNRAFGR